jgi:hypothetical protein
MIPHHSSSSEFRFKIYFRQLLLHLYHFNLLWIYPSIQESLFSKSFCFFLLCPFKDLTKSLKLFCGLLINIYLIWISFLLLFFIIKGRNKWDKLRSLLPAERIIFKFYTVLGNDILLKGYLKRLWSIFLLRIGKNTASENALISKRKGRGSLLIRINLSRILLLIMILWIILF